MSPARERRIVRAIFSTASCPLAEDPEAEETWCFYSLVDGEINVEGEIGVKRLEREG